MGKNRWRSSAFKIATNANGGYLQGLVSVFCRATGSIYFFAFLAPRVSVATLQRCIYSPKSVTDKM